MICRLIVFLTSCPIAPKYSPWHLLATRTLPSSATRDSPRQKVHTAQPSHLQALLTSHRLAQQALFPFPTEAPTLSTDCGGSSAPLGSFHPDQFPAFPPLGSSTVVKGTGPSTSRNTTATMLCSRCPPVPAAVL